MSTLALLQRQFMDYLHTGAGDFVAALAPAPGLDAASRAHIYFNAYRVRLLDTLRDSFDKTWAWLGDDAFEQAARAFIDTHPPTHFSLRNFGDRFPGFLAERHPTDPEVAELAMLDWALRAAFDGPDAPVLTADHLAALRPEDWNDIVLHPQPTLALIELRHNTPEMWHAMDRGDAPPPVHALPAPYTVRIWRQDERPHFRSIDDDEAALLAAMQRGTPFADACEHALTGDDPQRLGGLLARWLEDGLLRAPGPAG